MPSPTPDSTLYINKLPTIGHVTHLMRLGDNDIDYLTDVDCMSVYDFYLPIWQRAGLKDTGHSVKSKTNVVLSMDDPRDKSTYEVQALVLDAGPNIGKVRVQIFKMQR